MIRYRATAEGYEIDDGLTFKPYGWALKQQPEHRHLDRRRFQTRGGYWADVDMKPWSRSEFAHLGIIHANGRLIAWAWHANGATIDRDDPAFDLIDFPAPKHEAAAYFWLGAEAEAA